MTGDDRWYEAAFVVGITNALNVVADGLGGAVMRQVEPETAPAEVRAIFADIRTFYGTGGAGGPARRGPQPPPLRLLGPPPRPPPPPRAAGQNALYPRPATRRLP